MGNQQTVMTLFLYKSSGDIHSYCTGTQTMAYFGEYQSDHELMLEPVVVPLDDYVLDNKEKFRFNKDINDVEVKDSTTTNLDKYKKQKKTTV
jgi:hypothetical protein